MEQMIEVSGNQPFSAFLATPEKKGTYPGIIVIHEVWGLNEHTKDIVKRFAKIGYVALAPDLLSETGITGKISPAIMSEIANPATRDEAQKKMRAAMAPIQSPEFGKATVRKLKECVSYLLDNKEVNGDVAAVGYCFGGTYAYAVALEDHRIKAIIPYYGHAPEPFEKIKEITCPILAFYGEQDTNLVSRLPELKDAMKKYGKSFDSYIYPDTGHAFFNDTNPNRYNKKAAEDSWKKTLSFLSENL
jgi:carboxymethylenebutenolidase